MAGLRFEITGLAAGWDKSGRALRMLGHLGLASRDRIHFRTAMQGNPWPRLFRLPEDRAIVVNYGLPNDGAVCRTAVAASAWRAAGREYRKTNFGSDAPASSDDEILADYERSVSLTHRHASYLALNLSCPNAKEEGFLRCRQYHAASRAAAAAGDRVPGVSQWRRTRCGGDRVESPPRSCLICARLHFQFVNSKPETLRITTPRAVWEKIPVRRVGWWRVLINACIREMRHRAPGDDSRSSARAESSARGCGEKIRLGVAGAGLHGDGV